MACNSMIQWSLRGESRARRMICSRLPLCLCTSLLVSSALVMGELGASVLAMLAAYSYVGSTSFTNSSLNFVESARIDLYLGVFILGMYPHISVSYLNFPDHESPNLLPCLRLSSIETPIKLKTETQAGYVKV
jgi:hypothetical protein